MHAQCRLDRYLKAARNLRLPHFVNASGGMLQNFDRILLQRKL